MIQLPQTPSSEIRRPNFLHKCWVLKRKSIEQSVICRSQKPPKWLAAGGLCFHWIQSVPHDARYDSIFLLSSCCKLQSSFRAPVKLVPMSHLIVRTLHVGHDKSIDCDTAFNNALVMVLIFKEIDWSVTLTCLQGFDVEMSFAIHCLRVLMSWHSLVDLIDDRSWLAKYKGSQKSWRLR